MEVFKQECKLCDNIVTDRNFKVIEDSTRTIFDRLLLQLRLDDDTQNVMCMACSSKLLAALNFKSTCLSADYTILRDINLEETKPVDLKEMYAKANGTKGQTNILEDCEICRLCLHQINSDFKSQELPLDGIRVYIPEMNLEVTTNPVICTKCHDALCAHSSFIKNCVDVAKKRNMDAMDIVDIHLTNASIKSEEIEIKDEQIDDERLFEGAYYIKREEHEEGDTSLHSQNGLTDIEGTKSPYDLDDLKPTRAESASSNYESKECLYKITSECQSAGHECEFETKNKKYLKKHKLVHKNPSEVLKYKCDECEFETKHKNYLKTHKLMHKDPSEVLKYKCDECDYKTKRKDCLKQHQLVHKIPLEVQKYSCDQCGYKCIDRGNLRKHQITHKHPSEVQMYSCDECEFETKYKEYLKRHKLLMHKDASEVQKYMCDVCDFKTKYKAYLGKHQFVHKDPSQLYTCDQCGYKCIAKGHLRKHLVMHKEQTYSCDQCEFKTKHKDYLRKHQSVHKAPSQLYTCDECGYKCIDKGNLRKHVIMHKVRKYKCHECEFDTKFKRYIETHKLSHKNPSGVQLFECDVCEYVTKSNGNLKRHKLVHKHPSEVVMYECRECDYKNAQKGNLKKHQLKHRLNWRPLKSKS